MKNHIISIICGATLALVCGAHAANDNSRFTQGTPFQLLDDQVQANSEDIKTNADAIALNSSSIQAIETEIAEIQAEIVAINEELDALDARIASNQAKIAELEAAHAALLEQMEAADAALAEAIEANSTSLAELKADVLEAQAAADEAIAKNSSDIELLQQALLEATQTFNAQSSANADKINALIAQVETLADQAADNTAAITELANTHNADILATNAKLDEIAASLNEQIVALQAEVTGLLGQDWATQQELNTLQFQVIENLNDIILLQAQVNSTTSQNHYHEFSLTYLDQYTYVIKVAYNSGHVETLRDLYWDAATQTNEEMIRTLFDDNHFSTVYAIPMTLTKTATGTTEEPTSL